MTGGFFDLGDSIMGEPPDMLSDQRRGESDGNGGFPADPDDDGNPPDYPG